MTHTGRKPYACASCKAPFTTKSNLERHILPIGFKYFRLRIRKTYNFSFLGPSKYKTSKKRRHGIFDREGQANLVIKLSLEEQIANERFGRKKDAEHERFDHDMVELEHMNDACQDEVVEHLTSLTGRPLKLCLDNSVE